MQKIRGVLQVTLYVKHGFHCTIFFLSKVTLAQGSYVETHCFEKLPISVKNYKRSGRGFFAP